jgi:hypothetical protein
MSDLYVDPFYWEFGYAVGDQDLQRIDGVPLAVSVSAQGGLGFIKPLSAFVQNRASAALNEFTLNTVAPAGQPSDGVSATVSTADLEVVRIFFIAGSGSTSVAATGGLAVGKPLVASGDAVVLTVATAQVDKNLAVNATVEFSAAAGVTVSKALQALGVTQTSVAANLSVGKPLVASGDAVVFTFATALLGKRLQGSAEATCAVTLANAAILKAMASSAVTVASTNADISVDKILAAASAATATTQPPLGVGKTLNAAIVVVASVSGRTVVIRFVPAEIADRSTFDLDYQQIFVDAEAPDIANAEVQQPPAAVVRAERIYVQTNDTRINVDAELVEALEVDVTW